MILTNIQIAEPETCGEIRDCGAEPSREEQCLEVNCGLVMHRQRDNQ